MQFDCLAVSAMICLKNSFFLNKMTIYYTCINSPHEKLEVHPYLIRFNFLKLIVCWFLHDK